MKSLEIIQDAYERLNRLSPGETLDADTAAFGLRRLNLLVDELSAFPQFLFRDVIVSAAQTGNVTLGADAWAAISSGNDISSIASNGLPLAPITMQQYNAIYTQTTTGQPSVYAVDGLVALYLWPVPNGQTLRIHYRVGAGLFADYTTDYSMPSGYKSALGAALAVRLAPSVLGKVPPELLRAETKCMNAIDSYSPSIVDVSSFSRARPINPTRFF